MIRNTKLYSCVVGAIIAVPFVLGITILGEFIAPLKALLKEAHHHHWIGKGIWTLIVFGISAGISYLVLSRKTEDPSLAFAVKVLNYVFVLSSIAMYLFFTYEYLIKH